ncbi:MAG: serine/threonine protein kinase, partial [Lentisphaerae bacterium]
MTEESQPSFITDELDTRIIENIVEGKHSYGHIGPYEIKGLLGHGATSIVYKALGKDGKEYALKVFSYEKQQSRRELSRFYREIESLHRFRHHPNIITIHDAGHEEDQFFITMDLLPGRTLNHVIEEEAPIRPERALRIILQIAGAIECMHEGGYVHRDIKPSNIMLLPGDFPVLMDFGLVQIRNSDLTLPGSILGTPGYMAP